MQMHCSVLPCHAKQGEGCWCWWWMNGLIDMTFFPCTQDGNRSSFKNSIQKTPNNKVQNNSHAYYYSYIHYLVSGTCLHTPLNFPISSEGAWLCCLRKTQIGSQLFDHGHGHFLPCCHWEFPQHTLTLFISILD